MEPLWSPVVAIGGNWSQIALPPKPQKQAKTVAVGCDWLPREVHGEEGVDGSSPSEGSAKAPHVGAFAFRSTCSSSIVRWVWSRYGASSTPTWSSSSRCADLTTDALVRGDLD